MQVNLSHEMIKVVRAILLDHTQKQLRGYVAGWDPATEVNGEDALVLFEELYLEANLQRTYQGTYEVPEHLRCNLEDM
jgi:hypothetical protein